MGQLYQKEGIIARKGYKRMLLSYLPLVLISISAVVFISFIIVTDLMTQEAKRADTLTAKRVVDTIEGAARDMESTVLRELAVNRPLYNFMNTSPNDNMRLIQYELSTDLNKLAESYPAIQSLYVYRSEDAMVLTLQEIMPLSEFSDKEFIAAHFPLTETGNWLSARLFTDQRSTKSTQVLSLIQRFPLPLGTEGIVVVNVNVEKLIALSTDMRSDDLSVMKISDMKTGNLLYSTNEMETERRHDDLQVDNRYTFQYRSDYLGWTFYSGIKEGSLFAWVSFLSYIWIAIGILVLLSCVFASIYIIKRNYRPVELLISRIQQFPLQDLPKQKAADEFAYIEKALENLVETNKRYEQRHQEDWMLGKRQFIRDWLEGEAAISEWEEKARQFEIPVDVHLCTVALIELELDLDFQRQNQDLDQKVLKFSLANVVREQWQQEGHLELEWVASDRLVVVWLHEVDYVPENIQDQVKQLEELVSWIKKHLGIIVRIGAGRLVSHHLEAAISYHQARHALRYKLISGNVMMYAHMERTSPYSAYTYYRHVAECIRHLHTMNDVWREETETIFEQMERERLADEEIYAIIDYAAMLLLEEVEGIAAFDVKNKLRDQVAMMQEKVGKEAFFPGLYSVFSEHLERFYVRYCTYKKSNKYQETINRVKQYIEQNYTDPDLSLTQISDKFALKPKYASQLFKEEFGMKFVDFLLRLRMEEAKKKLNETEDSVQDIALQIGYATSISFGRMFKKMEGITPGEYRKMKSPHLESSRLEQAVK
ncbi:hypothetical protein J45TS6_11520 [Paenibacillus sp. J45TS6]|uniref:helix-turn-helix domain-containing protein n=1 Tax=unclassified Paenibacillus TaxID=185978 RepID=UPI001B2A5044|nr:helix-turn-helix domain-containing protein [Paenibacillus sp. J45TS6]GIP42693.1 hypothetical protein J45TS6_11520 [Paenibacillus sp. J45TS6]